MSTHICPRCNQFFVRDKRSGDFEHKCFGSNVLSQEDILVIGNWEDFTGSDVNVHQALTQGRENKLAGRPLIEGQKDFPRNVRGFPQRFRTRQHFEFIDSKTLKHKEIENTDPKEFD